MAGTTFIDKSTVIQAGWLQSINDFFYNLFQGATTVAQARTVLGIVNPSVVQENTIARQLVISDAGTYIITSQASPVTITIPSGVFSAPTSLTITQGGSGQVTVVGALGVNLYAPNGAKTAQRRSTIGILQLSTTDFYITGDTSL